MEQSSAYACTLLRAIILICAQRGCSLRLGTDSSTEVSLDRTGVVHWSDRSHVKHKAEEHFLAPLRCHTARLGPVMGSGFSSRKLVKGVLSCSKELCACPGHCFYVLGYVCAKRSHTAPWGEHPHYPVNKEKGLRNFEE